MLEKFIELVVRKFSTILFMVIGIWVPGILTIAIFNRTFFCEIAMGKLLILAFAIGTPTAVILFSIMISSFPVFNLANETETALNYACSENIIIFSIALLIKIFIRDLNLERYVIILVITELVLIFIWFLFQKKGVKEAIDSKENK